MESYLQWMAPEFEEAERGAFWHLGMLVVGILLGVFAWWQGNYLFLIFIVIALGLVFFIGKQKGAVYTYDITEDGIAVDGRIVYRVQSLQGFAMLDDGISPYGELVLGTTRRMAEHIRILVPREGMESVRLVLGSALKEFEYHETLGEVIMKRFGL